MEATRKTALAHLKWPQDVIFCRNRDMMKHGSSPSGDAAAGAGSAGAGSARTGTAGILGMRREGGHSVDCIGSPQRASGLLST